MRFEQVEFGKKTQEAQECSIPVEIRFAEVPTLIGEVLDKKLRSLADQLGAHKMRALFARIEECTDQTGQKLDAKGAPIDGRMLLDIMEMGEVGFDRFGRPTTSFVIHPNMAPALKRASEEVENDPELKRRLEAINDRQRQQWLDRENRRKLVD